MNTLPFKYHCGLSFVLTAVFFVCFLTVSGFAQGFAPPGAQPPSIRWETDLNVAMARAEREQRPLFIHFIGNDCQPAAQMANEVFVQPNIVAQLNANFVMVRINASENAALAQQFAVTSIPTDLVIKPNRMLLHRRTGGITAEKFAKYLAYLQETIQAEKGQAAPPPATPLMTAANSAGSPNQMLPPSAVVQPQSEMNAFPGAIRDPLMQQQSLQQPPMVGGPMSAAPVSVGPVSVPQPPANPLRAAEVTTARPAMNGLQNPPQTPNNPAPAMPVVMTNEPAPPKATVEVPLALEGFCPVTLCAEERWISGNPAYCTMYQGHIFRFASLEALGTFAQNPANYMPVAMGEDIILKVERNKRVNGNRQFGAWFQGRVFLFSSQESLDTFATRPEYYTEIALKYELAHREQPMQVIY